MNEGSGRRRFLTMLIAGPALLTTVGCEPTSGPDRAAAKNGTGELRTDPEPLRKRFPELGPSFEAQWMSGQYGDERAPGPSTYWIDAVIALPSDRASRLLTAYAPVETTEAPAVVDGLRSRLPAGPLLTSAALDAAFAPDEGSARAYLDRATYTLILVVTLG
ncbi:hypothetical protein [Microlunatus speluncae]|uniref:hypothetical protein n=1 Tax=Microlunatus speluncae TaxID=2594267 RepID=UPI001266864D|nr:hypothetical protein [Microlunatus speluncae]